MICARKYSRAHHRSCCLCARYAREVRKQVRGGAAFGRIRRRPRVRLRQAWTISPTASLVTRMTTDVTVMLNAVNAGLRPAGAQPGHALYGAGRWPASSARG